MKELLGQEGLINTICTKIAWICIGLIVIEIAVMLLTAVVAITAIFLKK